MRNLPLRGVFFMFRKVLVIVGLSVIFWLLIMAKTILDRDRARKFIMGFLAEKSPGGMYGLEIIEASDGAVSRGTVYVYLSELEDDGFIYSYPQDTVSTRKLYSVTQKGKAYAKNLAEPPMSS
jgi:DNA-binding PadR family transcriptional regulator